jgi:small subunit ribosomal protein S18
VAEENSNSNRDERPSERPQERRPRPQQRRRYTRRPRVCQFCAEQTKSLDYKQIELLKRYINEQKKIRPRRETGTCSKHQRMLARTIKKARHMALLPFSAERMR